jgi:hypothetical protein
MTQTEGNHGGNRSQPEAKLKGREDSKHPQGGMREETGMENNVGTEKLLTGPTTAVKTSTAATGGNRMPVFASTMTSKITTSSKLTRASYPIFNRHVTSQGQLSSSNKGKKNNSMTTAPESGTKVPETNGEAVQRLGDKEDNPMAMINPTAAVNDSQGNDGNMTKASVLVPVPNSMEKTNNSSTMAPVPVVHGEVGIREEKLEDNQDVGGKGMETALATAVNSTKKKQKKLTFTKIPREPSAAASKSGPMEVVDPTQGIDSGAGGVKSTKTTVVTPPQGATKKRKSLEDDKEKGQGNGVVGMEVEEEKTIHVGCTVPVVQ